MQLVVTAPFGAYKRGDLITDPKDVVAVLASNSSQVVKVQDQPALAKPAST
jgi:hypothetical protein